MNNVRVNDELERVGSRYLGRGVIVECGTWLGASMLCVSRGIGRRPAAFHCFDRFCANESEVEKAAQQGAELHVGQDTMPLISRAIGQMPNEHKVVLNRGDISEATWCGLPIEIFVLDAAKRQPKFGRVIDAFSPYWLEGASLCFLDGNYALAECQRDYLATQRFPGQATIGSAVFATNHRGLA